MKTIPTDLTTQLKLDIHALTHLFKFEFSDRTFYLTSYSDDIFYDSHWWLSKGMRFDTIKVRGIASADSITIEIDNIDKWFSDLALSTTLMGSPVTVLQAVLDKNLSVVGALTLFYGYFDRIDSLNQKLGTITVYNHMIKWRTPLPKRMHTATCPYKFSNRPDRVVGTDNNYYRCIVQHISSNDDKPTTGAHYNQFWEAWGGSGNNWAGNTEYKPGYCPYMGINLEFNNGGTYQILPGDTVIGKNSNASAVVEWICLESGDWGSDNATGHLHFSSQNGTFQNEQLSVGSNNNVATIGGNGIAGNWCDQSWERCDALGNHPNFGGFRWVTYLVDKEIWWGRGASRWRRFVR